MSVSLYIHWFPMIFWPLSWFMALMIHEIGHVVVFVLLTKSSSWHIYVGGGKPLLETSRFTIKANFFMGGKATFNPSFPISRIKTIWICSGGILFNAIFVTLAALLFSSFSQTTVRYFDAVFINRFINFKIYFLVSNVLMIAITLFPCEYRYGVHKGASDGLRIFRLLKNR